MHTNETLNFEIDLTRLGNYDNVIASLTLSTITIIQNENEKLIFCRIILINMSKKFRYADVIFVKCSTVPFLIRLQNDKKNKKELIF